MEAAAVSTMEHEPEPAAPCLRPQAVAPAPLALLEGKQADLFREIDTQLSNLSRAAAAFGDRPKRIDIQTIERAPSIVPALMEIPEIELPGPDGVLSLHVPRGGRGLRAAMIAGAVVATLGLAWIGASNLARLFERPAELTGKAAVDAVVERIISAESSDGADAKNKRSTAAGYGQFLDETWLRMIRVYRPDLAKGRSKDETLELRREATIAREMTRRFAERNAAMLTRRGLPVTAGTIYLAHFAGGAGAVAVLSAPADADAALVMANADATGRTKRDQIVKANPFLERFTVADLKRWADRKMRGPGLHLTELLAADVKK